MSYHKAACEGSENDLEDFFDEHPEYKPEELLLCICEGERFATIDAGYWNDTLGEDGELPLEMEEALKVFNAVVEKMPAQLFYPVKIKTEYKGRK